MNQILIPLFPRSDVEQVLAYAESVAVRSGARLVLAYAAGRHAVRPEGITYASESPVNELVDAIRSQRVRQHLRGICQRLFAQRVSFDILVMRHANSSDMIRLTQEEEFDLILMGPKAQPNWLGWIRGSFAGRIIGAVKTPVIVVPSRGRFNEIQHITYAVDLTDYDPNIIRQVKAIATLFDAKLTIAHVNSQEAEHTNKEQYVNSLEKTISDTLDYPKINYRFFDHADPLAGLKKLVNLEKSQMVAMTNRRKLSWRHGLSKHSLTRKMTRELSVPVLAFRKP